MSSGTKEPKEIAGPAGQPGRTTAKVLGLFMAIVLATATGCGTAANSSTHVHIDRNQDGYCDDDGQPMTASSGSRYYHGGGGYYSLPNSGSSTTNTVPSAGHPASISAGSHGGIGSGSVGSGS